MRPTLLELGNCLLWGLLLTLLTCGLGICGVWGWDGESGGNVLALFGLPMLACWFGTGNLAVGIAGQAIICVCLTCLVRFRMRRKALSGREGSVAIAPAPRTNWWIIGLLVIVGLSVTIYFVGF